MATNFDIDLGNNQDNFDLDLNDQVENFVVEFGEVTWVVGNDFNKLENRPSYNGELMTGDTNIPAVPTATSQLTNDANFQNANDVSNAISTHNQSSSAHQDIRQAITDEETARINADNGLQGQIDAITSASDVVDIVGTYAELEAYDTQHLKDNDVVKVLQDETHNDAMTYWRWNISTNSWTYIGAEGPYYTKSETNNLLDEKLDADEVPENFFDGPATITPTEGTSVEIEGGLKLKDINLKGDTAQQTYSGKNLMPMAVSDNTTSRTNSFKISLPAGTYTISFDLSEIELGTNESFTIQMTIAGAKSGGGNYDAIISGTISSETATYKSFTFTTTADSDITTNSNIRIAQTYWDNGARAKLSNIQIEAGSTDTAFEPYVGGVPSPNPDYPQDIHVVTGVQTITLTDGGNQTKTLTVDLDTIELCKIGTYQDYIYKSGDDWYVHKEIGKVIYDGTENWTFGTASALRVLVEIETNMQPYTTSALCSHLVYGNTASASQDNVFNIGSSKVYAKATTITTSADSWKTWLATHNVSLYYQLATPTDTKITDNALIGQLDNVLKATLYQPNTTISSSGNLPAIIKVEAYTEHLNSLLEIASEAEDTVFVGTDGVNAGAAGLVPAPLATDDDKYLKSDGTWATVSGGGGSITPVQTTGTSTTDVMSQNATTSMVFADPGTNTKVKIGSGASVSAQNYNMAIGYNASANGLSAVAMGYGSGARANATAIGAQAKAGTATAHNSTVAIGYNAQAKAVGAIAIGRDSSAASQGELNIGSSNTSYGYSSSNYRLLSGVYDGQNAHDAVTVGQINDTIDAINTALGTNIPHIGASS